MRRSVASTVATITAGFALAGCVPASILVPPKTGNDARSSHATAPTPQAAELVEAAFSKAKSATSVRIEGDQPGAFSDSKVDSRGKLDDSQFDSMIKSRSEGHFHVISVSGSSWVKPENQAAASAMDVRTEQIGKWIKISSAATRHVRTLSTKAVLTNAIEAFPVYASQRDKFKIESADHEGKKVWKVTNPSGGGKGIAIISADGKNQLIALDMQTGFVRFSDWDSARGVVPPNSDEVVAI
ncbi:hypothetical protein [Austwickia chelonae]|uniref:hypothetical protein n=1 Tax=Austwickia chelonae TaxID=100225 RepID=UPI0013C32767|nr:hypothetical protein [Austwickia chelonae]